MVLTVGPFVAEMIAAADLPAARKESYGLLYTDEGPAVKSGGFPQAGPRFEESTGRSFAAMRE